MLTGGSPLSRTSQRALALVACGAISACASEAPPIADPPAEARTEAAGSSPSPGSPGGGTAPGAAGAASTEQVTICGSTLTRRPWGAADHDKLPSEVVRRFVELKTRNDALIASRGVGGYVGVNTSTWQAIESGNVASAAAAIAPHLAPGYDAKTIAKELEPTSCIGRVYAVLRAVYEDLGRHDEWAAIEKCGRERDSDGLSVQQVLIESGWPAPALGLVTDAARAPGGSQEVAIHHEFMRGVTAGVYYGTPVSKTTVMKDFMPTAGSSTRLDESVLLEVGRSRFLAFGTLRGAYHVPLLVPASMIPDNGAPPGGERAAWIAAKTRGEPFVLESHGAREPWDETNFEVRPLTSVIRQTIDASAVYSTGTILFAPGSTFVVR